MFPLFESIRISDGKPVNLQVHEMRMNLARRQMLGAVTDLHLSQLKIPPEFQAGEVKCRLPYGKSLGHPAFSIYHRKPVQSLQLVHCEPFDYHLKYQDRSKIDHLYSLRGSCDDVLICIDQHITDCSYSNILLYDGTQWWTPASALLKGTQRHTLLQMGTVSEKEITIGDFRHYQSVLLINAMLDFDPARQIAISNILPWTEGVVTF